MLFGLPPGGFICTAGELPRNEMKALGSVLGKETNVPVHITILMPLMLRNINGRCLRRVMSVGPMLFNKRRKLSFLRVKGIN